jgi:hypothetical protein
MSDLLSRLQSATGPSRELDAEIALANGWTKHRLSKTQQYIAGEYEWRGPTGQICPNVPRYSESIDAALTLMAEDLYWEIGRHSKGYWAEVYDEIVSQGKTEATPAIALLIAIERAKENSKP